MLRQALLATVALTVGLAANAHAAPAGMAPGSPGTKAIWDRMHAPPWRAQRTRAG
jgi:hypothetical protein